MNKKIAGLLAGSLVNVVVYVLWITGLDAFLYSTELQWGMGLVSGIMVHKCFSSFVKGQKVYGWAFGILALFLFLIMFIHVNVSVEGLLGMVMLYMVFAFPLVLVLLIIQWWKRKNKMEHIS